MDLELVKFINSDLTWNAVKKGHRSIMKRSKKPATSNKLQESVAFDYEKSGVAILGQHFGDEVLDVPIKKRILMLNERTRSAQSQLPAGSSLIKSNNGSTSTSISTSKQIEKQVPDLNDFSGIELLAAAACHSSVVEEPTEVVKDEIIPVESNDSSVQDDKIENPNPSKDIRLHWDLNTVMDEWEEPCCDILVDPHSEKGYSKSESQIAESQQVKPDETDKCEGNQSVSEVLQGDKVTSEDRMSDCCGSNTVEKVKPGGYESPVEDGELRDTWQKVEVEEMECVDYESDNIYEDNFDTIESNNNEVIIIPPKNEIQENDKKLPEHSGSSKGRTLSFVNKNDSSCIRRSRSENFQDSCLRSKREFGQEKSTGRDGPLSRNSYRYTNRPKHVIGGSRNINYESRGSYKSFNTKPERNEYSGIIPHRDISVSRDKYKSGLGFHHQGSRKVNQEDYPERKVSSFSSNFNRGSHISRSRRRSRSRSRSESPIAWNFQKKRNLETKKESPDESRDRRVFQTEGYKCNFGRMKSSDDFNPSFSRSERYERYPQQNGQYDEKYGGGRFRYYHKDNNGYRYSRNDMND